METKTKKKVLSRNEKVDLAVEAMQRATRQLEGICYEISAEDIGPLYVAYTAENNNLYISAGDLEGGWVLSFYDLAEKLIEGLADNCNDSSRSYCSKLLVASLHAVADKIEQDCR